MAGQTSTENVLDGEVSFIGGQDASKAPDQVRPGYVFAAINSSFKNATWRARDPFFKHPLIFPEGGISIGGKIPISYKSIFESGKYQAIIPYSIGSANFQIIVVSGIIYNINQDTLQVQVITPSSGPNLNQYADRLNWSLAARYLVIFDYPLSPMLIQNFTARRAVQADFEVPISVNGAYNQNRLIVANAGNEFTAGDPTGSLYTPDAPITFEEVFAPGAPYRNQFFQLPTSWHNNPITSMGFLQTRDASTGIGPLIVSNNNQIFAFQTQNPRQTWEQTNTFGQVVVHNAGIAGQRAQVNVNGDLWFGDNAGQVRSLSMSRNEQTKWSSTPQSREVQNWLKVQDTSLTKFYALTYFNNKIFCTANPIRKSARDIERNPVWDYAFGGMVVIELDNVSNLSAESPPVWAGLWTGIQPMDFSINDHRCFVVAKDGNINTLWEMRPDLDVDMADDQKRLIRSTIYTRSYGFQDSYTPKNLLLGEFPFSNVKGKFDFTATFKPAHSANFLPWSDFSHFAPYEFCGAPWECPNGLATHNFNAIRFGSLREQGCDPVTGQPYINFNEMQLKFEVTGVSWELPRFKLKGVTKPIADTSGTCPAYRSVPLCQQCDTDWKIDPFGEC